MTVLNKNPLHHTDGAEPSRDPSGLVRRNTKESPPENLPCSDSAILQFFLEEAYYLKEEELRTDVTRFLLESLQSRARKSHGSSMARPLSMDEKEASRSGDPGKKEILINVNRRSPP
jgi:hypothetical protein